MAGSPRTARWSWTSPGAARIVTGSSFHFRYTGATISSTADSPIPATRRTRRRPTTPPPCSWSTGKTRLSKISFISEGTPGRTTISVSPRCAQKPGAVPLGFSRTRAPTMKSACLALHSGIAIPRRSKRWRILSTNSSSRRKSAGSHAATAATVTSSAVGPRPPVVTIRRAARDAFSSSSPTSTGSSPTIDFRTTGIPISSRRAESQSEFVSWRSGPSISLPIATIAADSGRRGLKDASTLSGGLLGLLRELCPLLDEAVELSREGPSCAGRARARRRAPA